MLTEVGGADASTPGSTSIRAASLATRSPRRGRSRSFPGIARRRPKRVTAKDNATEPAAGFEEIAARAARLGITVERVLREYASIAFADLRHIVDWAHGEVSIRAPDDLSAADAASIQEIVSGEGKRPARVKLYDKKAALDAIARHLGMFPPAPRRREDEPVAEPAEDPREVLERLLARLAPDVAEKDDDGKAEPESGGDTGP